MSVTYHALLSGDRDRPGLLRFGGARMCLLDIEAGFWGLRRQMEALVGRQLTDSVLQQAGANGGASFAQSFLGQAPATDGAQALRDCVAAYQAAGFGQFEIEALEWPFGYAQGKPIGHAVIRAWDTFEAWMMRQHGQAAEGPVCAYSAGVLVGFVNVLAGRHDVVCVERACQAQGAEACLFELLPAEAAGDVPVVAFAPDPALRRQLNLLEILFERMPMGIVILDRDLRLRRFNPTWASFVDRYSSSSASQVVPGVSFFDLAPGTEADTMPVFERVLAGETVRQEAFRLEIGGIVSYWDAVITPLIDDEEVVGIVHVATDATEQVLAHQELEARVEARTHELSTLLEVSHNVASTLELEPLLGLILDQLKAVVDYNGAAVMTLAGEVLTILAYRGPIPWEEALQLRFPLEDARINREVLRRREPVIISDVWGDTPLARAFRETAGEELETTFDYIRSWMGVPLMAREQVIGMLSLDHSEPNYYSPRQAELALAFANEVAVAIENARLFEAAQRRAEQFRVINKLGRHISSVLDLDELLWAVVHLVKETFGYYNVNIFLVNPAANELVLKAGVGGYVSGAPSLGDRLKIGEEGILGWVAATGEPLLVNDVSREPRYYATPMLPDTRSELGVPIKVRGQVVGTLDVQSTELNAFDQDDLTTLQTMADQIGVAVENAQLFTQAERSAAAAERSRLARDLHDAVTQTLFSASLIAEVLPRLWERNPEEGQRRLEELRELTRGALAEMRTLLLELRPEALVEAELGDLLRQLAESITGRARVPVTLAVEGQRPLPLEVKVALYRIAHEALNNVAKHAGASQATLNLRCLPKQVELHVSDDGRGFDPESISPESLGLGIMRERAEAVGATLTVKSEVGRGTEVVVVWSADERRKTDDE